MLQLTGEFIAFFTHQINTFEKPYDKSSWVIKLNKKLKKVYKEIKYVGVITHFYFFSFIKCKHFEWLMFITITIYSYPIHLLVGSVSVVGWI